jgi:hypothetical protein
MHMWPCDLLCDGRATPAARNSVIGSLAPGTAGILRKQCLATHSRNRPRVGDQVEPYYAAVTKHGVDQTAADSFMTAVFADH